MAGGLVDMESSDFAFESCTSGVFAVGCAGVRWTASLPPGQTDGQHDEASSRKVLVDMAQQEMLDVCPSGSYARA